MTKKTDITIPKIDSMNYHKDEMISFQIPTDEMSDENLTWNRLLIIKDKSDDKAPLINLSSNVKVPLAIVMAISLLIGTFFKCIMYLYVSTLNKKRPINTLIVTSAIIHHTTHLIVGTWYILVLLNDIPLGNLYGTDSCHVMMSIAVFGLVYLNTGSLGISVYRVLYIKHESLVKYIIGENVLLMIVLSFSLFLTALATQLYMAEDTGQKTGINMCTGLSVTQALIYIDYNISRGESLETTMYKERITIVFCLAVQTIELSIYVWFFHTRYKNDNGNITMLMSQEDTHQRNLKNIGTFLGQFYAFVVEYSFLISLLIFGIFANADTQNYRALLVVLKFADFGLLSCVEVLSSPQLRIFMKQD